ncbi:MAG: elongation factor P, partial [Anaerolineae bacterium]
MISANDLRRGTTFEMDGELYKVVEYQHSFIGRGSANVRVKMRNLRTGTLTDRTFSPNDRINDVRLELRGVQYLYNDGTLYYFMDTETYEQPALSVEILGDALDYLTENMTLQIS